MPDESMTLAAVFAPPGQTEPVIIPSNIYRLGIDKTFTLTAQYSDGSTPTTLTWGSNTTAVATVDQYTGLITGISAGTSTITATDGTLTATFSITVQDAVTNIDLTQNVDNSSNTFTNGRIVFFASSLPGTIPFTTTKVIPGDPDPLIVPLTVPLIWSTAHPGSVNVNPLTGEISLKDSGGWPGGEVTVNATATDGSSTSSSINVYIRSIIQTLTFANSVKSIEVGTGTYTQSVARTPTFGYGADATSLIWTSSNPNIASVDSDGLVTAGNTIGSTTITVTADDADAVTANYTVNVVRLVTSITVDPSTVNITIPDTFTPTSVTISPNNASDQTYSWSSSNIEIATVDSSTGTITPVKAGKVTITATAADGSGITGAIIVDVIQLITSLAFDQSQITVYVGVPNTLNPTITPSDASNKNLSWSSSDPAKATVDSSTGQITGVTETATPITITATTTDGTDITASFQIIVEAAPISNICFVAGTPVDTDQGPIPIEQLDHNTNTINGQPIVAISKIVSSDSHLIFLKANCLGPNQPSQDTTVSKLHKILYNGTMFPALNLPNAEQIPYDGEPLYNVLLENYSTMTVNNLTVETLHPRSNVAVLYKYITTNNIDTVEKNKLISLLNEKLEMTNGLRKAFFSNIVFMIMLNLLTEPKEETKVTPYSLVKSFIPNAALISKSNPLF